MIYKITSRSNPKVKDFLGEKEEYFIFEGEKLVRDILARRIAIAKLIINQEKEDCLETKGGNIEETWYVHESVLTKISSLKETPDFIAALKITRRKINLNKAKIVIALDNVQDPGNAGAIFRCAAAFGIDSVALAGASVSPNNPRFLRAAQTSLFDVDFQHFADLETLIKKAKAKDFQIYLTSSGDYANKIEFDQVSFPCLVVFGNEGQGLREDLFGHYPVLYIPQAGTVESLNVGVSACIIMHELRKVW